MLGIGGIPAASRRALPQGSRDLAPLLTIQAALLDRAVDWLRPGGTLVFSTCSLEAAEGETQLERLFDRNTTVALDPIAAGELPAGIGPDRNGSLRLLPGTLADAGGVDGFFIARLTKR